MNTILITIFLSFALVFSACGLRPPAPKPAAVQVATGVSVEGLEVGGLTSEQLAGILKKINEKNAYSPHNARFDNATGEILNDKPGRSLDIPATTAAIMQAPPYSQVQAVYRQLPPDITSKQLFTAKKIGSFTSPILDNSAGRLHNVVLTAKLINNTILGAGQEFSFNRITGEPTEERGFKQAPIFGENGRHEQGLGGGMCQVSSTLYNAVLAAKLPVTERHPHSQPVTYVPPDRDATTFTDKDFRFLNTTSHKIVIRAIVQDAKYLVVDLWSLPGT